MQPGDDRPFIDLVPDDPSCDDLTPHEGGSGFSLLELVLVLAIMTVIVAIGYPALLQQMVRARLMGASEQLAGHLYTARREAMKKGFPVVIRPNYAEQRLLAFVEDEVPNLVKDPSERTVFDVQLPSDLSSNAVYFQGPAGVRATEAAPGDFIDGLTSAGGLSKVAVFEPDGSIRDLGAFRLSDDKPTSNVFEVRIAPAAAARIEIRKWIYGGASDGTDAFLPEGGGKWEWY
jgi:prepilin-type N-terminal cleavage/methylation domain-containing protein